MAGTVSRWQSIITTGPGPATVGPTTTGLESEPVSVPVKPPVASVAQGAPPAPDAATRTPSSSLDVAGALGALQSALRDLSLLLGPASGASAPDQLVTPPSDAPGSGPEPNAPGPLGAPTGTASGAGSSPFGGYWLWLFASLFASAGLAARLMMAPAAWRSTAILALLERPG